jgi:hypothetical protein
VAPYLDSSMDLRLAPHMASYVALVLSAHGPVRPRLAAVGRSGYNSRQAQLKPHVKPGNKKERVPEGPLSKPFGLSDRYEVSIDGQRKYSGLLVRCKGHIPAATRNIPAAKVLAATHSRMPAPVRLQIFLKTKKHDVRRSRAALA